MKNKALSCSGMCRLLNMSRSQFYWHMQNGTFHKPLYKSANRPYFTPTMVQDNLTARETGIGIDGSYVIFYDRKQQEGGHRLSKLIEKLNSLGVTATVEQVKNALKSCGKADPDDPETIRLVFRALKSTNVAG